jgi:hypothetical protein
MFVMGDDPVATLLRWESAGGVWRVVGRGGGSVTIGLFPCDGGEQIDLLWSDDANLLEFVGARESNVD